nr:polyprenyl synthetase family protein [Acidimicrobiia bacterium]
VLAGDLAFVWADELLDSTALPAAALDRARRVFTELRTEVMAGQYLDLVLAAAREADEAAARKVALLKSARYTVTRPLELGAALAPAADPATLAALRAYGDAVGLAFQLRDDVLGLFGDPTCTGKGTLDDLREGKRTMLALRALRLADPAQRVVLGAALGDPTLDEERAEEVRAIVRRTGALASIELLVRQQADAAMVAVEHLREPARSALVELATTATDRLR